MLIQLFHPRGRGLHGFKMEYVDLKLIHDLPEIDTRFCSWFSDFVENGSVRPANVFSPPCPLLSWWQIFSTQDHHQETFWCPDDPAASACGLNVLPSCSPSYKGGESSFESSFEEADEDEEYLTICILPSTWLSHFADVFFKLDLIPFVFCGRGMNDILQARPNYFIHCFF